MTTTRTSLRRLGYVACAALTLAAAGLMAPTDQATAAGPPTDGVVCESNTANTFDLDATDGYISMPDGNSIYMWSYTVNGHAFQFPGPVLCVQTGARVTVVLHNHLREDTSIVFSGQGPVSNGADPVQPQFDTDGRLTSLTDVAAAGGGQVRYSFTAGSPGTYLYQTGTDVRKQKEMGLYGALIVHPVDDAKHTTAGDSAGNHQVPLSHDGADTSGNGAGYAYDSGQEYLHLLSSIDPALHSAVETNKPYGYTATGAAKYFLINGRSMPDTLAPNGAAWLPSQPYGGLIHIQPTDPDPGQAVTENNPQALLRYLNAGDTDYPFHPHGSSQRVIVRDGVPLVDDVASDASYEKFLVNVGPGQSVDALVSWGTEDGTPYNTTTQEIPSDIQLPAIQDQIIGPGDTWFSENPYLGPGVDGKTVNAITNGTTQNNQCGEYYQIAHSHALQQSTNYGASFGGMMTLIRIDPVGHFNCAGL